MWNSLTDYIVDAPSVNAFKNRVDEAMEKYMFRLEMRSSNRTWWKSNRYFKISSVLKRCGQMTCFLISCVITDLLCCLNLLCCFSHKITKIGDRPHQGYFQAPTSLWYDMISLTKFGDRPGFSRIVTTLVVILRSYVMQSKLFFLSDCIVAWEYEKGWPSWVVPS
jgi:hypothetical protein